MNSFEKVTVKLNKVTSLYATLFAVLRTFLHYVIGSKTDCVRERERGRERDVTRAVSLCNDICFKIICQGRERAQQYLPAKVYCLLSGNAHF